MTCSKLYLLSYEETGDVNHTENRCLLTIRRAFMIAQLVKESACEAGDPGSIEDLLEKG